MPSMPLLRSLLLAISVLIGISPQAAPAPSRGEAVFRTAWRTLPRYLLGCAASQEACSPDPEVLSLVKKLSEAHPFANPSPLRFVSGRERPGLFTPGDETHRMAVTGLSPNSEIFINTDVIDSVSFEEALGLLAHEVTHHQGVKDDASRWPDRVASALRAHALASTESWSWKLAGSPRPLLLKLHNPPRSSEQASGVATDKERLNFPAVWIELEDRVYDLSHVWVGLPFCPYGTTDLGWVRYESPQKDQSAESFGAESAQALVRMKASSVCLMSDGRKLSFSSAIGATINIEAARHAGSAWQLTNRTRIEFKREDSQAMLASVTKIQVSRPTVKNGETLSIDAEIRSRTPLENFCIIDIGSDDFKFPRSHPAAITLCSSSGLTHEK